MVAKAVLEKTDHHLIVGKGAQDFARQMGFTIEEDLNTETSRSSGWSGSAASIPNTTSIRRSAARR